MNLIFWIVILTYSSLLVELVVFPVPSVASTRQLTRQTSRPPLQRLAFTLRGLAVGAFLFLPLVLVLFPRLTALSHPLAAAVGPIAITAGLLLIIAGRGLSLGAALFLRRGLKPFKATEPPQLVTARYFRFSRNPILLGLLLMYVGLICLLPHALLILGVLVIALHMHDKVRLEEHHLEEIHGEAFRAYCARTRRYL